MADLRVSQTALEVLLTVASELRVSQTALEVLGENTTIPAVPCSTGGTVATSTNPAAGTVPTSVPLLFLTITLQSGTVYPYAETPLADATSWYGGKKEARILRVSRVRRSLSGSSGAYQEGSWSVELADTDRLLRGLQAAGALMGARVELYLVEDSVRRAAGAPFRVAAGVIAQHQALSGFRYQLNIEDTFGNLLTNTAREKRVPRLITTEASNVPGLNAAYDGYAEPIIYGTMSDDTAAMPQGVVPATYVGQADLASAIGGVGVVDLYMVCGHAVGCVSGVFFNNPNTPDVRHRVPDSAFGSVIWMPHKPGWTAKTSMAGQYLDYNGFRRTAIFMATDIPYATTDPDGNPVTVNIAEHARNGSVTLTCNLSGVETAGDGTGTIIDDVDRIWQHFVTNYVFNTYTTGAWAAIPSYGSYSVLDSTSVSAAKTVADARVSTGYKAGILIGRGNQQQSVFDVLRELCFAGDMDMGINRHGQLMISREDTAAAAAATFSALSDILEDGFDTRLDSESFYNSLRYRYARRYAAATAPRASTYHGWALPERVVAPYAEWISGVVTTTDSTSVTNVQQTVVADAEFHAIRAAAIALDVASKKLARSRGPTTSRDGSRMVTFTTGLQGFEKAGAAMELGTVIAITHPEGLTTSGWTSQRARVLAIEFDPATYSVTLECRVLS